MPSTDVFTNKEMLIEVKQDLKEMKSMLTRHIEHCNVTNTKLLVDNGRLKWLSGLTFTILVFVLGKIFILK